MQKNTFIYFLLRLIILSYISFTGCGSSCMAVVKDPGAEILGGDDLPEAAIDPNAPQIRVSHEYIKLHILNIYV